MLDHCAVSRLSLDYDPCQMFSQKPFFRMDIFLKSPARIMITPPKVFRKMSIQKNGFRKNVQHGSSICACIQHLSTNFFFYITQLFFFLSPNIFIKIQHYSYMLSILSTTVNCQIICTDYTKFSIYFINFYTTFPHNSLSFY